ncbi:hypothetical protein AAG570_001460 [Ranatra chinensis]|uniref:Uncharacterized protein n=1 Tax=Ranatra chinensis TaxID=642074 RepID=A0ABD0YKP1_9HEMI
MASKRRNMFHKNKTQETTEEGFLRQPSRRVDRHSLRVGQRTGQRTKGLLSQNGVFGTSSAEEALFRLSQRRLDRAKIPRRSIGREIHDSTNKGTTQSGLALNDLYTPPPINMYGMVLDSVGGDLAFVLCGGRVIWPRPSPGWCPRTAPFIVLLRACQRHILKKNPKRAVNRAAVSCRLPQHTIKQNKMCDWAAWCDVLALPSSSLLLYVPGTIVACPRLSSRRLSVSGSTPTYLSTSYYHRKGLKNLKVPGLPIFE